MAASPARSHLLAGIEGAGGFGRLPADVRREPQEGLPAPTGDVAANAGSVFDRASPAQAPDLAPEAAGVLDTEPAVAGGARTGLAAARGTSAGPARAPVAPVPISS